MIPRLAQRWLVLGVILLTLPARAQISTLNLWGSWQLAQEGTTNHLTARVPGNVHLDLLREGSIPDPFYRDNAGKLDWVYKATWTYERTIDLPANWLTREVVLLRCEGLDTVAHIEINDQRVADTDNMYRTWEFNVKKLLHAGSNKIRITFSPIQPYIDAFRKRAPKMPNAVGVNMSNLRKSPYANGWDFCARFLPCGIYRPISLVAYDTARLAGVRIDEDLTTPDAAKLSVEVAADRVGSPRLSAEAVVKFDGRVLARRAAAFAGGTATVPLSIAGPELWWPNGMGAQPLYTVEVRLFDQDRHLLDTTERRIGLRTIQLLPKTETRPLRLAVNGHEIYAKGADWVPADVFPARATPEKLRRLVADAAAVNMNMIRVWGGGYYPEDAFLDACDEHGILIWSDFMFACAPYPGNNPEFVANVRAEVTNQVARLRSHACIAVLAGNNEVEGLITNYKAITREDYDHLFHKIIGTEVKELFPAANYVGGSPEAGDEHNWWVWHVGADFEKYRESHGWMTEFGFESFPAPATVQSYTSESDRDSVLNGINRFHQKNGNRRGNQMILDKLNGYFRPARDFDSTLWLSQIQQSYGMNLGIEHWRTDWPESSGSLAWQLNDCWAGPTWSSIDFYGRWKAAQYGYRRAYAPVLITGLPDDDSGTVRLKIASDLTNAADAQVQWRLTDLAGKLLVQGGTNLSLPAGTSAQRGPVLTFDNELQTIGRDHALLWLTIAAGGKTNANLVLFTRPKNLDLPDPKISTRAVAAGDGYDITLTAAAPALWAWLDCADADARYSDNFVHLFPGEPVTIHVAPAKPGKIQGLRGTLKAQSLFDTYMPTDKVTTAQTTGAASNR